MAQAQLSRTLTLWPAVGLAITMVVGSGVLVLPGLAYESQGAAAVWSWVIAAAVCVPLLTVIASLGARYPTAGGIAGFVRPALGGRVADITELLLLAAIPGGAGLALVAGHLVADLVDVAWLVWPVAAGMLLLAGGAALRGTEFAGALMRGLVATFVATLVIVAVAGLASGGDGLGPGEVSSIGEGIGGVGLVFFAFVGWELMTFMSEEFIEPKRDFPRMIAVSFLIVVGLYVVLAEAVQVALDPNDPRVATSPVATVAEVALGDIGRVVVTAIGVMIVMANVQGVVVAFSRLVFASARLGRLPSMLAATNGDGTPRRAIAAPVAAFGLCIVPERLTSDCFPNRCCSSWPPARFAPGSFSPPLPLGRVRTMATPYVRPRHLRDRLRCAPQLWLGRPFPSRRVGREHAHQHRRPSARATRVSRSPAPLSRERRRLDRPMLAC